MTHLFLSHLSQNNNCPDLFSRLFREHANGVEMVVAPRYVSTPVYHIHTGVKQEVLPVRASQLELFQ